MLQCSDATRSRISHGLSELPASQYSGQHLPRSPTMEKGVITQCAGEALAHGAATTLVHVREGRAHEGEERAQQIGHARREVRAGMASDDTRLFFRAELAGYRIKKIEEGDTEAIGDIFVPSIAIPEFMERFRTSLGRAGLVQAVVLLPVTGRSRVQVAVYSHCIGKGKACH